MPAELEDVYPLSHYEYAYPPDHETIEHLAQRVTEYIEAMGYNRTVMLTEKGTWQEKVAQLCSQICKVKKLAFEELPLKT